MSVKPVNRPPDAVNIATGLLTCTQREEKSGMETVQPMDLVDGENS
jgi:hypothetical protein